MRTDRYNKLIEKLMQTRTNNEDVYQEFLDRSTHNVVQANEMVALGFTEKNIEWEMSQQEKETCDWLEEKLGR